MSKHILYLTYDGLTDALGQSQVLSYLGGLSQKGYSIQVISFEKADRYAMLKEKISGICAEKNITWHALSYTASPPILSTLKDFRAMAKLAKQIAKEQPIAIVHCRSYIPALVGHKLQKDFDVKFVFDMRGFWPDEKLESGSWAGVVFKPVYSFFKRAEKKLFAACNTLVSLTYAGKEEIVNQGWKPENEIKVIPTCVNFEVFKPYDEAKKNAVRNKLGITANAKVLVYSGSLGGHYDIDIPFAVYKQYQQLYPETHFLILSKTDPQIVDAYVKREGLDSKSISVLALQYDEVGEHLMAGDVGFIFYAKAYSNKGRSPTKLGEYWASGLPVLSLANIGDVDFILDKYPGNGALIQNMNDPKDIRNALTSCEHKDVDKLRADAIDYYALDKGIAFYDSVYKTVDI